MALWSKSLLNPPPLPPMTDGVEFYVTESETVMSPAATPFAKPAEPFRACTVLVSFARSAAERSALWPLRHALAFGQTSSAVCDGAEWLQKLPKRLLERLKSADHGFVTAVIYAGSGGASVAETVQATVDALRQCFGASLATLLVISNTTSSHQFARVQGVSGFVVGTWALIGDDDKKPIDRPRMTRSQEFVQRSPGRAADGSSGLALRLV